MKLSWGSTARPHGYFVVFLRAAQCFSSARWRPSAALRTS